MLPGPASRFHPPDVALDVIAVGHGAQNSGPENRTLRRRQSGVKIDELVNEGLNIVLSGVLGAIEYRFNSFRLEPLNSP
jgi:hypothetical protein